MFFNDNNRSYRRSVLAVTRTRRNQHSAGKQTGARGLYTHKKKAGEREEKENKKHPTQCQSTRAHKEALMVEWWLHKPSSNRQKSPNHERWASLGKRGCSSHPADGGGGLSREDFAAWGSLSTVTRTRLTCPPPPWMFINIPLISQLPPLSPHHHTHSKPKLDLRRGEWGTQCNTILLPIVKVRWCLVHALVPVIHEKVTTQEHIWKCQRLSCHTGHYQYIHVQMWLWVWQLWILTSGFSAERTFISFCIRCILSLLGL